MEKLFYNDYLRNLSEKFLRRLDEISGVYGFEYGIEFELAICEILRAFLPDKYGVSRGFVVTKEGEMAGDDIIIYDQQRFPTLRNNSKLDFAKKEQIPVEAVFAYFEIKHTLVLNNEDSRSSINYAVEQVKKVKELCNRREKVGIYQIDPHLPEIPNSIKCNDLPNYRNPIFTGIISRYVADTDSKNRIADVDQIYQLSFNRDIDHSNDNPELIILGKSNYLATGYYKKDNKEEGIETLFHIRDKIQFYGIYKSENLAYGILLAYLMNAIDFIRLGKMPWTSMINQLALGKKTTPNKT
ncbi:MAG: hypothetical protein GX163_12725 [Bacteroidetes bacterium]|nr:hypothetical protein [Bacteroidota bacterium]